jgi:hypothetical protein
MARETEPTSWKGIAWRVLKRLDPICMLSLVMSVLAFFLVLDCRHPDLLPRELLRGATAAEKAAHGENRGDAGKSESEGVDGFHGP